MKQYRFKILSQINQPEYIICLSLIILINVCASFIGYFEYYGSDYMSVRSGAENFILVSTTTKIFRMSFILIFPLLAATLCAGYRKKTESTKEDINSILRMNKKKYFWGEAFTVVFLTVISFVIPFLINLLLCTITYPISGYNNKWGQASFNLPSHVNPAALFDIWTTQNPYIYNLLYIILIGFLAGGIALLTYGLGLVKQLKRLKSIQLSVIIFLFLCVLSVAGELLRIPAIQYSSYVNPGCHVSLENFLIFTGTIYLVGFILTFMRMRDYENI